MGKIIEIRNILQQNIMLLQLLIIQLLMCLFNVSSVSDNILSKTLLRTP